MPFATIDGVRLYYEVLGGSGPWVALSPGGRRPLAAVRPIAEGLAQAGCRVLVHDRRNCGLSDMVVDPTGPEDRIWADDLHGLLEREGALPAILGGASSGCRLSLLFAQRYPDAVRALLLWRMTGGAFAAKRLGEQYFGEYIRAAETGGMAGVCATEHFGDLIAADPAKRERLMAMDPRAFVSALMTWRDLFLGGADAPVLGIGEADLRSIAVPTCIIPGNDKTHPARVGQEAARLIPGAELHAVMTQEYDLDVVPLEMWDARQGAVIGILVDFLRRKGLGGAQ